MDIVDSALAELHEALGERKATLEQCAQLMAFNAIADEV